MMKSAVKETNLLLLSMKNLLLVASTYVDSFLPFAYKFDMMCTF